MMISSLSSGGAERVATTLANHWAEKGWEICIVTMSGVDRDFYAVDARVRRIAIGMDGQSRNTGQAVLNNLRRILAVARILRREKPDVAVAMMTAANATLALAGRLAKVPTVGSERVYPPAVPLGRLWEMTRRRTYPLLSGLVAQTRDGAEWLRGHAPAPRIEVIPNPVDYRLAPHSPRVSPSEVLTLLRGHRVLLAAGRLEEQKGFDRLLRAFAVLAAHHPDWSMVILGHGCLREALTRQASELGIEDRVALPGAVGNVGEWYEAADLYALTSRFEGFPNTLLEAMAYGVPAVTVDCETGPREIVRHHVDGLVVPQVDHEALVAALDRMMGDEALRARFRARAVEVRDRFSVERIAAQWESLFQSV